MDRSSKRRRSLGGEDLDDAATASAAYRSVVKIFATTAQPSFALPWSVLQQQHSTATGFLLSLPTSTVAGAPRGQVILTNAHAVTNATALQVRAHGSARKHAARVLAVCHDADVALIAVDDAAFWRSGVKPLVLSDGLPHQGDAMRVVGFPLGGDSISVTAGVVSRLDMGAYSHSGRTLLMLQLDAAINSGNSGGPAFSHDGCVVGAAFQSYAGSSEAENVGYVIPASIIKHVLADYVNRRELVFGRLGFTVQPLENETLRRAYGGGGAGGGGVIVSRVRPVTSASAAGLRAGDVLVSIDGVPIAGDGTIALRGDERVHFSHVAALRVVGEDVDLEVLLPRPPEVGSGEGAAGGVAAPSGGAAATPLADAAATGHKPRAAAATGPKAPRSGARTGGASGSPAGAPPSTTITMRLESLEDLVPPHLHDKRPSWLQVAGLVVTNLSVPYLQGIYGKDYDRIAPIRLVHLASHGVVERPGQTVVILADILSHSLNLGYSADDLACLPLLRVKWSAGPSAAAGSRDVTNLKCVVAALAAADDAGAELLTFELAEGRVIVLPREAAARATLEVAKVHSMSTTRSADLAPAAAETGVGAGAGAGAGSGSGGAGAGSGKRQGRAAKPSQ